MSDSIVNEIIETRLNDNWALTPIDWDNIRYVPNQGEAFITPIISNVSSNIKAFRCSEELYTLIIEVRVKDNTGLKVISSYCDTLKNLFVGYTEGNFRCVKGYIQRIGKAGKWYQKNVVFECRYKQLIIN